MLQQEIRDCINHLESELNKHWGSFILDPEVNDILAELEAV